MHGDQFDIAGGFVAQVADKVEDGKLAIGGAGACPEDFHAEGVKHLFGAFVDVHVHRSSLQGLAVTSTKRWIVPARNARRSNPPPGTLGV